MHYCPNPTLLAHCLLGRQILGFLSVHRGRELSERILNRLPQVHQQVSGAKSLGGPMGSCDLVSLSAGGGQAGEGPQTLSSANRAGTGFE